MGFEVFLVAYLVSGQIKGCCKVCLGSETHFWVLRFFLFDLWSVRVVIHD